MATKHIVPRGPNEGGLGKLDKPWGEGFFNKLTATGTFNFPLTTEATRPVLTAADVGASMFDTDIGGLIIWDGTDWVEAGGSSEVNLQLKDEPAGAASTLTGAGVYAKGDFANINTTAAAHYEFSGWTGNINNVDDPSSAATFVEMKTNLVLTASFSVEQNTLTVNSSAGGTATGSGDYDWNSAVAINAFPDFGYELTSWDGTGIADPSAESTFVNIDGNKTVTANFALKQYDLVTKIYTDTGAGYTEDTSGTVATITAGSTGIDHGSVVNLTTEVLPAPGSTYNLTVSGDGNDYFFTGDDKTTTHDGALGDPTINMIVGDTLLLNNTAQHSSHPINITDGSATQVGSDDGSGNYTFTPTAAGTYTYVCNIHGSMTGFIIVGPAEESGYVLDYWSLENDTTQTLSYIAKRIDSTGAILQLEDASGTLLDEPNISIEQGDTVTITNQASNSYASFTGTFLLGDFVTVSTEVTVTSTTQGAAGNGGTITGDGTSDLAALASAAGASVTSGDGSQIPGTGQVITLDGAADTFTINIKDQSGTDVATESGGAVTFTFTDAGSYEYYSPEVVDYSGVIDVSSAYSDPSLPSTTISMTSDRTAVANYLKQPKLTIVANLNSINPDALAFLESNLVLTGGGFYASGTADIPVSFSFTSGGENFLFDGWTLASNVADSTATSTTLSNAIDSDLILTANFSLATVTAWFIIHDLSATGGAYKLDGSGSVYETTTGGGATVTASTYDWDLNINGTDYIDVSGQITTSTTGTQIDQYSNGTVALGGTTVDGFSITVDAFTALNITTDFSTSTYGFVSLNGHGTSSIFDSNDPNADITLIGNSLFSIQIGLKPNSNFTYQNKTTEGSNVYFGDTLTFYDVSTPPSNDGIVSSSVFSAVDNTTSSPASFYDTDTGIRVFREHKDNPRNKPLTFNTPGRYGDPTQEWTIFIEAEDTGANQQTIFLSRGTLTLGLSNFLGNGANNNWYFRNVTTSLGQNFGSATTYGGRMIIKCTPSLSQTMTMLYRQETGAIAIRGNPTNLTGPATTGPLVIGGAAQDNSEFTYMWEIGYKGWGALYKSIGLLPRASTSAEEEEFLGIDSDSPYTELTSLSYLSAFDDYYNLGSTSQGSIAGENLGNFDLTFAGEQPQFVSIGSIDIPFGSPGDTTGSFDVTLTVTDDQGLEDTETQTITFGPTPLEVGSTTYTQNVTTTDGLNLLANTSVLEVDVEVTDGSITTQEDYL